ncbi:MAG: NAD(P)-binding domain-containing protein, partial [Desulfitobacterium hafniense]
MRENNLNIGFVGTGVMGRSMVKNLLKAGYSVAVYNRTKSSAEELFSLGAHWTDSVAGLAKLSDVVITMVGYPKDVEEVYLSEGGLIPNAKPGSVLIDMTTSSPLLARKITLAGQAAGIDVLDAPVSGGDVGAQNGTLVIMVGGEEGVFDKVKPIFEAMGKNIILQGPAG